MTKISSFLEFLRSDRRFLLSGHEHPDGDCLGSQVGLYHLMKSLASDCCIVNPDPVARSLRLLEAHTPIGNYRDTPGLPEFDALVLLDCSQLSRLGDLAEPARKAASTVAVIDHHVGSEHGDGDQLFLDVTAAATGVLIYDLYQEAGVEISQPAAEGLFVSIVADTGWFRYSNTDRRTLSIAADLIGRGVAADRIYDQLHRGKDPRFVGLLAESLAKHEYQLDGRLVLVVLGQDLNSRIGRAGFDTDAVLEPIRSVAGVEVAVLFKVLRRGVVKLSLRSMGSVDVQAIAASFGGGGHVKAAGATVTMDIEDVTRAVREQVEAALQE